MSPWSPGFYPNPQIPPLSSSRRAHSLCPGLCIAKNNLSLYPRHSGTVGLCVDISSLKTTSKGVELSRFNLSLPARAKGWNAEFIRRGGKCTTERAIRGISIFESHGTLSEKETRGGREGEREEGEREEGERRREEEGEREEGERRRERREKERERARKGESGGQMPASLKKTSD